MLIGFPKNWSISISREMKIHFTKVFVFKFIRILFFNEYEYIFASLVKMRMFI